MTVRVRSRDPETSWEVSELRDDVFHGIAADIYWLLAVAPSTDEELYDEYLARGFPARSPQRLRTARSELARQGYVKDSGERRPTKLGNKSIVWAVIP